MFAELSDNLRDADESTAQWCLNQESHFIEAYHEASLTNGASSSDDMACITYFKVGLRDGCVPFTNIGQATCGDIRTIEREASNARWQIAGAEQAPWLYKQLAQRSKVMTWKILTVNKVRKLTVVKGAQSAS